MKIPTPARAEDARLWKTVDEVGKAGNNNIAEAISEAHWHPVPRASATILFAMRCQKLRIRPLATHMWPQAFEEAAEGAMMHYKPQRSASVKSQATSTSRVD